MFPASLKGGLKRGFCRWSVWNDAPLQERYEREDPFLERIYFGPYWKLVFLELGSEGLNCLKCPLLFLSCHCTEQGEGGSLTSVVKYLCGKRSTLSVCWGLRAL